MGETTAVEALRDRLVLVTGATGGIGTAAARRFAAAGARVALHTYRRAGRADALAADLPGTGHFPVQADLTDAAAIEAMVDEVVARGGGLDVLVNNAGVYAEHPIAEVDFGEWASAWETTLGTNLVGPALLCHRVVTHMLERGGGRIVNVSSRGAFRGEPDAPAYGASKAGLNALSQSLARALAPRGVLVFAVAPGFVETEMAAECLAGSAGDAIRGQSPFGRVATADEVARVILYLAGEAPEFATGAIIDVNGASYLRS